MNKQEMSERVHRELVEYQNLKTEAEKTAFWSRIRASDDELPREDRLLINEVIHDDLQALIGRTKQLLRRADAAQANA